MDVRELDVLSSEAAIQLLRDQLDAMASSSPTREHADQVQRRLERELEKAETGKSDEQLDQELFERNWTALAIKKKG